MENTFILFLKRIKKSLYTLANLIMAGRHLTILPDDIFIVSYPKSGNTWVRFLIGNLVSRDQPISFSNVENKVPDIYQANDTQLLQISRPRYLKSHEYFDPRYKKVIYIVRDPRDVLVSYYHHQIKFKKVEETKDNLEDFSNIFLSGRVDTFGTWEENVKSWISTRGEDSNFLILKYEDLLQDTFSGLKKIAKFIDVVCSDEKIKQIVAQNSADNMKSLEKEQSKDWKVAKSSRQDIFFVREAKAGGWKNALPPDVAQKVADCWGKTMKEFGYL